MQTNGELNYRATMMQMDSINTNNVYRKIRAEVYECLHIHTMEQSHTSHIHIPIIIL